MAMGEDGAVSSSGSSRAPVQQRLHDSFRTDRRYLSQMVVEAQNERSTRVDAVLELKKDLDASAARIGAQSAAIQARDQADRTQQARMHQSLIDQGKNPYEVARHKVVQREARKERSRIDRNIQDREAKLLERIEAEKIIQRRREKIEAENRAYERKYQREMGRAAQEERTNTYLLSRTGKESLDPTGKLVRVYPSQETTIKDNSFGLGRSAVLTPEHRRRVVKKVLSKPTHTGTELSSMLLPRRQQSQRDSEDPGFSADRTEGDNTEPKTSERPSIPSLPGVKPGQDLHKVNHALLSNSDVKLPPIRSRSRLQDPRQEDEENQTTETSRSTKRKPQSRSVLEERQLTKARQRQKDLRFTQTQVVWGRTFTGNAFLANPPMLWFKDFDVNRPFTLGFTLTNVSNTFNQFRLLAMEEEVIELFDIVYEKPGRMSAGMSCSLKMTFTGNEERDLETTLSVAAPTGVFQLPVRCTCKKSVPILAQREVRFPEIVAGERVTVTLTLANEGALPLEYRVRRVLPFPIEPEAVSSTDQAELENDDKSTENDGSVDVEVTNDDPEVQSDANSHENPQEDSGQTVEDANSIEDLQQLPTESRSSRATSATSTKLSVRSKQFETATEEDDVNDSLSPDEQELIDRVLETTLLKPKGAEEPIRFTRRGVVAPYSSSTVSFTFAPAAAMTLHNQPFVVEFPAVSSPDLRRLASIPLLVSGVASQVPVFVSRSQLDFRCCAFGKLYRHQLVVCNRGKVALKVQVQVPKPLAGYVEFNPSFGFVQAAASQDGIFPVQVRFRPEEKMWKRIERAGLGSRELGMLAVPVQVVVPDQVVPVFFLLTARLTSAELQIKTGRSDKGLHFGACCVGHSVSHELTIANAARVPQRIGVTSLPKDVTVADVSEGVGVVLLPGEERTLRVVYMPSFPGVLKGAGTMGRLKPVLTLSSSTFNHEYNLPCSGSGVASDLVFSQSAVRLGATSLGQTQTCNVYLTNQSDRHVRLVELRLPPEAASFLRITPLVARLAPRETVRLEIDFEPTEDIFKLAETLYYEAKSSDERDVPVVCAPSVRVELGTGVTTEERHNQQDEELEAKANTKGTSKPRGCHLTWTILCFHQLEGSTDSTQSKTEQLTPFQALEARTTVVQPFLIPSTTSMDFGQVAIGQTLVRDLILETSPGLTESVLLRAQPLHILGAFRLIGALREVPAGSDNKRRRAIRVEFEPRTPLMYEDELELAALGVNIRVKLRGVGINPSLSLTPEDGNLDFQDVLARTRNVRELVLTNGSAFPLAFSIVVVTEKDDTGDDGESITTSTGLPVFTFSPTSAIIPENGSLSVQVVFQPDHQRPDHYSQRFRIKVPNESEQHIICVSGRCWEDQLYAFAPTAEPIQSSDRLPLLTPQPVEDLFDLPPSISLSQLPLSIGVNGLPALGLRRPTSSFVLTFAGDETDTASIGRTTTTLFIGSTLPSIGVYGGLDEVLTGTLANAGGSAGSFELVVDAASPHAKLFTLEPARGSIAAGQQLAVQVTYNPDTTTSSSSARTVVSASAQRRPELEVLQWVQVRVQCVLKGGSLWRTAGGAPAPVMAAGQQPKGANSGSGDGADTRIVMVILRTRLEI
ncbi:hypothetical protein PC129_g17571 [Phytophthora cactorum]|uniref:MSP domain-containing protein n=2 Tax=Phytophthora cactorum TaxID=29920 RepID=A0A8T0YLB8_9STRA|nr:hypothetical protein Pcac1_g17886 [Phytophthora cactorum]KAG2805137.1 hypothetical protein PC111_g17953 [Phytophthora cactorum]KAG2842119.1 hypothetical protein PC113_g18881 [Phytophthora cactorum]KAG2883428.1 hypothetical protein PC114_g20593 [Phytophthora cactorum]KAG2906870.1 hypothetical protein PC117_g20376 [Phytophthora cactorum]